MEGKKNIFINDDHGCNATAMTPQELLRGLKNEGDSTHTAISIYLQTLNSFSRGHARQDPGVNSKKKPDSDEEEKEEEEREEEEEEVPLKNSGRNAIQYIVSRIRYQYYENLVADEKSIC
jgi:hypothetical protein